MVSEPIHAYIKSIQSPLYTKSSWIYISPAKCALLMPNSFREVFAGMKDPKKVYMSRWKA